MSVHFDFYRFFAENSTAEISQDRFLLPLAHAADDMGRQNDKHQAHGVGLALVNDVLGAVHVHVPDLVRNQIADGDHGCAVDAVDRGMLGNVGEERIQGGNVGHVALIDVCALRQVLGRLFAAEDEGAHGLAVCDQIADDGAAQIARSPGYDIKLIIVRTVVIVYSSMFRGFIVNAKRNCVYYTILNPFFSPLTGQPKNMAKS